MSRINYPSSSPYAATKQTSWYIGNYVSRPIPADKTDTTYTIAANYDLRPDKLSYDFYNDPSYWWVFYVRNINLIRDPIWDFRAGLTITVPSLTYLKSVI